MQLGDAIKVVRMARGVSAIQLSKNTGFGSGYISLLENNLRKPSWDALLKICAALNVPVSILTLLCDSDSPLVKPYAPFIYMALWNSGASIIVERMED